MRATAITLLLVSCAFRVDAQDRTDEQGIRGALQRFEHYWNAADAKGLASLFAPTTDYINASGWQARSRIEAEAAFA